MTPQKILKLSRPRFWIYLLGPFILGITMGIEKGVQYEFITYIYLALFFIYFTFPANFLLYAINDIYDYATDILNPKKTRYEAMISPPEHFLTWTIILATSVPILLTGFGIKTTAFLALVAFWGLSAFYSADPIRAKARPFLDSAFNILYLMPGIIGYALIRDDIGNYQLVLAGALWCMAMHAYSAVPDIVSDTKAGLSTVATKLGFDRTLLVCLLFYITASLLTIPFFSYFFLIPLVVYSILIYLSMNAGVQNIFKIYTYFPVINTSLGFLIYIFILWNNYFK
jgi:lycopene elongase/hydratase (dihydrobisanhydrobacterioruberin-forming)